MHLLTPAVMREIDREAAARIDGGEKTLMRHAGLCVVRICEEYLTQQLRQDKKMGQPCAAILCGRGNNGGDGYVVASALAERGWEVAVFEYDPMRERTGSAGDFRRAAQETGCRFLSLCDGPELRSLLSRADVLVDAVFGTGFRGELPGELPELFRFCGSTTAFRIAVDCPSGINPETGDAAPGTFPAQLTAAMSYPMRGSLLLPARQYVGRLKVCDIGIDRRKAEAGRSLNDWMADEAFVRQIFPPRSADTNKGSYGRVLLVCGSEDMPGAAILALSGALRMGVGICELCAPASVCAAAAVRCPEAILTRIPDPSEWTDGIIGRISERASAANAALIGCGLGIHRAVARLVQFLLDKAGCPLILDADALNSSAAEKIDWRFKKREVVLTPHPKELSRLTGRPVPELQKTRYETAKTLSAAWQVTLLSKGADTIIAAPDGRTAINPNGNPGLAKGGSGDVLAGFLAGLAAQKHSPFDAAVCAAYLHGASADRLKEKYSEAGFRTSELPDAAASTLSEVLRG